MKTVIIGAGAMGGLFGALLAEAGADVVLLDIWEEHVRAMNAGGLQIEREGATRTVRMKAVLSPEGLSRAALALVFVKAADTARAAETAGRVIGPGGLVLTLQNGLGHADVIAETVDPSAVLAGTTAQGATLLGPGRIRHAGVGPTLIGPWSGGDLGPARKVAEFFTRAGIATEARADVRTVIWGKLLVNVGINAVTALTGIRNGQLLDLESTREVCRLAVEEAAAVARALGVEIREDAVRHVLEVARATGPNRSSMGQDVDRRRPTEIGAINGVVVREGRRLGLPTPVNLTLAALVETLETHYK
ncbi:MAG: 2-dehydropantoate 2-reductase [Thermodesulfobacteriota bacterium]